MCFGATCSTCSGKSWRGCGSHIPGALRDVPEDQWCTCKPQITVDGKAYPPSAKTEIPGLSWLSNMVFGSGGGEAAKDGAGTKTKEEL